MRDSDALARRPGRAWRRLGGLARLGLLLGGVAACATAVADQRDVRLDDLFASLRGESEWRLAEASIWTIWLESGDSRIDALMRRGLEHLSGQRLQEAVEAFTEVIEQAPAFAEAWNKRATAYYLLDELEASVADIHRTLALEPRHFGAISGMGLIFMRRHDPVGALEAFQRVLEVHPHASGARHHVEILRRIVEGSAV